MKIFVKWSGIVLDGLIGLAFLAGLALYLIGMKKLNRTYPDIAVETSAVLGIPVGEHHRNPWCDAPYGQIGRRTTLARESGLR